MTLIFIFTRINLPGVEKLLDICSELPEFEFESRLNVTENTRLTTSICISRVYDTQYDDKARQALHERIDEYIRSGSMVWDNRYDDKLMKFYYVGIGVSILITCL